MLDGSEKLWSVFTQIRMYASVNTCKGSFLKLFKAAVNNLTNLLR